MTPVNAPEEVRALNAVPEVNGLFSLDGQVALVTGASGGLGARFARVLHAAGATVVASARRVDRLEKLRDELGDRLEIVAADVANDDSCRQLVSETIEIGGGIDILVNNAGIGASGPAEDEDMADFRRVMAVNLDSLFLLSQLAAKQMIAVGRGSIVNIASVLGLVAASPIKQASYCASKGAVINLTRELGVQWARKGVRVNALAPGWFHSEMTDEMLGDERSRAFLEGQCPMARVGESHELDGALLFLASNASSYMTGQVLTIDGGWTAR